MPDEDKFELLNPPKFWQISHSNYAFLEASIPKIAENDLPLCTREIFDKQIRFSVPVTYGGNPALSISESLNVLPDFPITNETETIIGFSGLLIISYAYLNLLFEKILDDIFTSLEADENPFCAELEIKPTQIISSLEIIHQSLVTRNLLTILTAGQILGKKYSSDWDEPFKEQFSPSKPKDKTEGLRIHAMTYKQDNVHPSDKQQVHKVNFFEIIFPLLMPPPSWKEGIEGFIPAGKALHKYQLEGIERLLENKKFLLADEMGTGKTVISVTAMRILFRKGEIRNCLILCPVGVMRVWADHIFSWGMGELKSVMVRGQRYDREALWKSGCHVFISSYETYRADYEARIVPQTFDLLILDEAHNLKIPKTKKYRAVKRTNSIFIWAVTGTPLENKIDDVKALFELLLPKLIPVEELNPSVIRQLIKPYMLRRLKKDILKELPPKVRQVIWLQLDDDQRRAYEGIYRSARSELIEHVNNRTINKMHIFAVINQLKQICNFAPNNSRSPKSNYLLELLEEIASRGNKVIIFSQYINEGISKIQEIIKNYGSICLTGKTSSQKRDEVIDAFRTDQNITALAMTIKAGGLGLTLTEASYVVHFDHWYNPSVMMQAEDRVHRKGQKANSVTIYEFWMEDTYEEKIYQILEEKRRLAEYVIDYNADETASQDEPDSSISTDEWLTKVFGIEIPQAKTEQHSHQPISQKIFNSGYVEQYQKNFALLRGIDPLMFERLTGEVMRYMGYPHVILTQRSSDGGIDLFLWREIADKREIVVVQCKRYAEHQIVGVQIVRELLGVVHQKKITMPELLKGILITTSDFSMEARSFVATSGGLIEVINGGRLAKLITDYEIDIKKYL